MSQTNPPSDPPAGSRLGQDNRRSAMDENQDVGIGSPSADAAYYGYENESGSLPIILMGFGAVVVTLVIAGLVYLAYMKGLEDGQSSTPPVLLADNEPVKVKPEEPESRPENEDLNIYSIMTEDDPPAEPGTGEVESLVYDPKSSGEPASENETPAETSVVSAAEKATENTASPDLASRDAAIEAIMGGQAEEQVDKPADDIGDLVAKLNGTQTSELAQTPPKPAPTAPSASAGAYIIQLLSVRTAEQADNEFKRISRKYKDLISDREPLIIPRDLGEKGIYYRVNIAGFETKSAASSLCNRLKERGQDCLVRKAP